MPKRYSICPGKAKRIYDPTQDPEMHWTEGHARIRPSGMKRIRMTCELCRRRVWSSISTCDDGCCLYHDIPPHKPKGWWKRAKKKIR